MNTERLTMAQAIVRFLKNQYSERDGVEQPFFGGCFGIFGHGNVAGIGQALQQYPDFRYYQTRNEQAMVHTAAAYAKHSNRMRTLACTSSIGPGASNMVTGAATATINRLPVLILPGDIFARRNVAPVLQQLESEHSQDISVNDCFKPVSRYWDRINRPDQLTTSLIESMRVLTSPADTGEQAARQQLDTFINGALSRYEPERNYPGREGTSCLSAALRFGTIGPRTVWQASQEAMATRGQACVEAQQAITVWQQELAWREFYQQALFHFPGLEEGAFRPPWRQFPWRNRPEHFAAWCEGRTGYPIVDAAMRQLLETGWMHNRCRMIVASFLTKDLICDWRWGEAFFMQHLVDGDLAANNGGWQWSASSGMDPRPLRIFNPSAQAARFDEDGDYIRRWLPELSSCGTADLLSGRIAPLERRGYPEPLVDHRQQQARFRQLYAIHVKGETLGL